jgi:DNA-directed RNA polymerase specialized sigma subunit
LLHTGLELISRFDISDATNILLHRLYQDAISVIPSKRPKAERDAMIRQRYEAGETMAELAKAYGISEQRVHQIIRHYCT